MRLALVQLMYIGAVLCSPRLDPLVDTKKGLIRGLQASDGDYAMFLGIPYAKVNESNVFGPSHPHPNFDEVFEAYDDSVICPQVHEFTKKAAGSLDCLRMNIYVPNTASSNNRLPVLVWIYGGGFQIGYASRQVYGPKYLVRNGVILVTINYRVGLYGFMCLKTEQVPGNQGLKDQLLALRWIRDNIESFGGDANKVTVFGESAGSISVEYHLLSAQEKLFDKAILQSGSTLYPWGTEKGDIEVPVKIAKNLGLDTDDNNEALAFLTTVEPRLVIKAVSEQPLLFQPCVEKSFEGIESFITEHPVNSAIPKAKSIPILIGHNSHEMLIPYAHKTEENYKKLNTFHDYLTTTFDLDNEEDLLTLARQFYVGDEVLSSDVKRELMAFESDFIFNHPVHRSVLKYLSNSGKVYHYLFSYSGSRNYAKFTNNVTEEGAAHADEIGYLFDVSLFPGEPSRKDQLVIDRMTTMWTNFAKYGNPTPDTTDLLPVIWTPVESNVLNYLNIDSNLTLKRRPFHDRMAFWDLFYKMNMKRLRGYEGTKQDKTKEIRRQTPRRQYNAD